MPNSFHTSVVSQLVLLVASGMHCGSWGFHTSVVSQLVLLVVSGAHWGSWGADKGE